MIGKVTAPRVNTQGKIVAECYGEGDWMVLFPDGTVRPFSTESAIATAAKAFFQKTAAADAINAGVIEWRDKR